MIDFDADPDASDEDVEQAVRDAEIAHHYYGWNRGTMWDHNGDAIGEWTYRP